MPLSLKDPKDAQRFVFTTLVLSDFFVNWCLCGSKLFTSSRGKVLKTLDQ